MELLNDDCLAMVFDFLVKSERNQKKRQELALSLCRVCSKWQRVVRSQPSRFIECAVIDEKNHSRLPLERVRSAIVEQGTPFAIVNLSILRFTDTLRHLELTDVPPRRDAVLHLRSVKLASLFLRGKYVSRWKLFWKDNPHLTCLRVKKTTRGNVFLRELPTNLTTFVGSNVDANCLIGCASLERLSLDDHSLARVNFSDFRFPALKEVTVKWFCSTPANFDEFARFHSRSLRRIETSRFDMRNLGRVEFPELEYLNAHSLLRREGFENFPKLKTLVVHDRPSSDLSATFPTEASDVEDLTLLFNRSMDVEAVLGPHVERLTRLRILNLGQNHGLLEKVTERLKVLRIEVSNGDVLDLKKFVALEELAIDSKPGRSDRYCFDDHPFVVFPERVGRVAVNAYFSFSWLSRVQIEELSVETNECNYDFIRYCFRTLRVFRLDSSRYDPDLENYLSNRVFNTRWPSLYAMYVPSTYKRLKEKALRWCEGLKIFEVKNFLES